MGRGEKGTNIYFLNTQNMHIQNGKFPNIVKVSFHISEDKSL